MRKTKTLTVHASPVLVGALLAVVVCLAVYAFGSEATSGLSFDRLFSTERVPTLAD